MTASTAAASAPDSGGDHHSALDIDASPTQSSSPSAQAQSPLAAMAMKVGCRAAAAVLAIVIVWLVCSHCRKRNKLRVRQVPVRTLLLSPHDCAVGIRRCSVADFQGVVAPHLAHRVTDEAAAANVVLDLVSVITEVEVREVKFPMFSRDRG
jgi:hypothetical protein